MRRPLWREEEFRPFNRWLNAKKDSDLDPIEYRLLFSDLDVLFMHNERTTVPKEIQVFLLEVKTHGKRKLTPANAVALALMDAALNRLDGAIIALPMWGVMEERLVRHYGAHVLVLSGETPDDSEWMTWDAIAINVDTLIGFCRFTSRAEGDPTGKERQDA